MRDNTSCHREDAPFRDFYLPKPLNLVSENVDRGYRHGEVGNSPMVEQRPLFGVEKEYTAWDVYNNEARKVDAELVKDWRDNLNSLLLFAAIFAAVLTAFVVESKKMLEQDQMELLTALTAFSINNAGNHSNLPFNPPNYEPPRAAILVNCLLFASLGASLCAAMSSVFALQWVADYDASNARGGFSPEERAKRRQFRFAGIVWWKMREIIAALPLLLYSSVGLFWAGLILWMWTLHHTVGYVVAGGTILSMLFYAPTTLLSVVCVSAPFRSPHPRRMYRLYQRPTRLFALLISVLILLVFWATLMVCSVILIIPSILLCEALGLNWIEPSMRIVYSMWSRHLEWIQAKWRNIRPDTSHQREDRAVEQTPQLREEALSWVGRQLIISENSHRRLLLLLGELIRHYSRQGFSERFSWAPWLEILDYLGCHYMRKILGAALNEDDYGAVEVRLQSNLVPEIRKRISPSRRYQESSEDDSLDQQCFKISDIINNRVTGRDNMAFLFARDVPRPSPGSKHEIKATIELIKWRNTAEHRTIDVWMEVFSHRDLYSSEYIQSCLACFERLVPALSRKSQSPSNCTPVWFLSGAERGHIQILHSLETVGTILKEKGDHEFHYDLISVLLPDVQIGIQRSSHLLPCSEVIYQRLCGMDPCLALIGAYACGLSFPVERAKWRPSYAKQYSHSISRVRSLYYNQMSLADPLAIWKLRGALWSDSCNICRGLVNQAYTQSEFVIFLQLILEHPTYCCGHSTGPQHALLHLYKATEQDHVRFRDGVPLFQDVELSGDVNPILQLLALSERQDGSVLILDEQLSAESMVEIKKICQSVKKQLSSYILLLTDIASAHKDRPGRNPLQTSLILKLVESAITQADFTASALLKPLAGALRGLVTGALWQETGDLEHRAAVMGHADRICNNIEAESAMRIIFSPSQRRLLSCARAATPVQPAIGVLAMDLGS